VRSVALVPLAALSLAGCAEKAIGVHLTSDDSTSTLDVSCVSVVHVIAWGTQDAPPIDQCIPVSNPSSLADLEQQLKGKLELGLPDELVAVEIRGLANAPADVCGFGTDIFYAGRAYEGEDDLLLRAEGTLDCKALQTTSDYRVRPIDFLALVDTAPGAVPVCQTPTGMSDLSIGTIRPTNIDVPEFPSSTVEPGIFVALDLDGISELPAWGEAEPTSCLASASFDLFSASCLYPGNPQLCAAPGELEVPMIRDDAAFESIDQELHNQYPVIVLGAVWDTVTKQPVAGATITIDPARGRIVYADRGAANRFDPQSISATNESGLFIAYMREPSVVHVSQGGSTKVMRLGGDTYLGSAVIVPLR